MTQKILHIIDSFDFNASARQLQLLGPALAHGRTSVEVCCLGSETPWLHSLRKAGVIAHALAWTRWFDASALLRLRGIVRESMPDLIHVWNLPTLRAFAVVARELLPRVVVSAALPATKSLAWWDRCLLNRVRRVVVAGESDRDNGASQGVEPSMLHVVPPAAPIRAGMVQSTPGTIACIGPLERERGFREAVWAFDFIKYLWPEAQLHILGSGSQQDSLEALATGLQCLDSVRFLGKCEHADKVLRSAEIVWIPSLGDRGRHTALDVMALGATVIASDVPCLREVIRDGLTGMLIPAGDVVALVRRTHELLKDTGRRKQIGIAARQFVQSRFPLERTLECWRQVYQSAA